MKILKSLARTALSLTACLAGAGAALGAVTYVDPIDIIIPFNFEGVYLDLKTAATSSSTSGGSAGADSYTISYTEPGTWDLNLFFGGAVVAHSPTLSPYRASDHLLSAIHNVAPGSVIDGGAITPEPGTGASAPLTTISFGGSGTGTGGGLDGLPTPTHMGPAGNQFVSGMEGYIAFVLDPATSPKYGWIRVTLRDNGGTGLIHDWAYSDTPLAVGAIPEPAGVLLLGMGSMVLLGRRRRLASQG